MDEKIEANRRCAYPNEQQRPAKYVDEKPPEKSKRFHQLKPAIGGPLVTPNRRLIQNRTDRPLLYRLSHLG
jgi:hypothetical protein